MTYKIPKTRIKVIAKANGVVTYQPQYKFFLWWENMRNDFIIYDSMYNNIESAQQRINSFIAKIEEENKDESDNKVVGVTYVTYP